MSAMDKKAQRIREYEERFAHILAIKVIDKPKLSIWMILIPIIFVYFFYQMKQAGDSRKEFAQNYLIPRMRALSEAVTICNTGKDADIDGIAKKLDLPDAARQQYAGLLKVLVEHYTELLQSDGEDCDALIRAAYKSRMNYLFFIKRLSQAEKKFTSELLPQLSEKNKDINEVISKIDACSEELRRENAEKVFA